MTTSNAGNELSIGMVGYAFMGAAHSQAWRNAPRFFDLPLIRNDGRRRARRGRQPRTRPSASAGQSSRPTGGR